jgi:peptidoglycan/xylan/chitin deacetylase (PgdA/CDA1 family)
MSVAGHVRRALRRWSGRHPPAILLYHRVARIEHDPWGLAVPPDLFADQMEALSRRRRVVPLDDLAADLERGRAPVNCIAITFDDGYADLLHEALPAMRRFGCTATLFLTTGALDTDGFWWDRLSDAIFGPQRLPDRLTLGSDAKRFRWEGSGESRERGALHMALWRRLRGLDPVARERELADVESWAGRQRARDRARDRILTTGELRELAASGAFAIGAHSISHPPLPELTRHEKAAEIAGSRRRCEEILGRPVTSFAYPFGEMDAQCREEVRRAGFRFACSTVPQPVRTTSPRFALPRISVPACSGEELLERLP